MNDSREHFCPRCGASLPTVTVKVPVHVEMPPPVCGTKSTLVTSCYEEREEPGECFRCTGSY